MGGAKGGGRLFGILPAAAAACGNTGPWCGLPRWAARRAGRGGEAGLSLPVSKWRPRFSHFPLFLCLEGSRGGGEVVVTAAAAAGVGGAGPGTAARRRERGSFPACGLSCSELRLSGSSYKGRVSPFELLVRCGGGGWVMGPSLSLSLAAGGGTLNKVGSKIL